MSRAVKARRKRREDNADEPDSERESGSGGDSTDGDDSSPRKRRRGKRGGRKSSESAHKTEQDSDDSSDEESGTSSRKVTKTRRTRQRKSSSKETRESADSKAEESEESDKANGQGETTVRRRRRRRSSDDDGVTAPKGSTRLEAKRRRRKESRRASRRRTTITESEYLARREAVDRVMLVREQDGLNQIAVLEDDVLVEHYVARHTQTSMVGNVYLGRVQNVLPSMEAAFVDIGKGRNAVLYAGEVNWDSVGMSGKTHKIEDALKSGDPVLVQVTKDPIGHKGARLTGQVTLAGRHLVLVPGGSMMGISRKLPDTERSRLKSILKKVVPGEHGVIVRTAAEGATEEQLQGDVDRLAKSWKEIQAKSKSSKNAPSLLKAEPELAVRVVRDIFNEDFKKLKVSGDEAWKTISQYVEDLSPDLVDRLEHWESDKDIFAENRVDEQLAKAFDRKVFLPSGGSLIIERTEAMTVIDVNTGKFTGSGGTLEETVTRNNLEAAEEVVRQLRLRDIGGIIVIDFIDMVLEENRDLVLRRLIECLGRDRTRHQVAEVTSLGLVQMTRKRVGQGLVEAFSTTCECCDGHGYITHENPVERGETDEQNPRTSTRRQARERPRKKAAADPKHEEVRAALANIAAAASSKNDATDKKEAAGKSEAADKKEAADGRERASAQEKKPVRRSKSKKAAPTKAESGAKPEGNGEAESSAKADGNSEGEAKPKRERRRVTSSGTISTGSSGKSHIMSFPVKKD
ncbi:Ribonuclease G [Trueperella bialowiezensis]|uniref:Ribonuclease E n=2 Tax=Trueperella bialowiezensis TaxID=312285 RepID=A0A448PGI0_9ACTO|nr:Ribonuclease G [Trueperella bialowiezensis]